MKKVTLLVVIFLTVGIISCTQEDIAPVSCIEKTDTPPAELFRLNDIYGLTSKAFVDASVLDTKISKGYRYISYYDFEKNQYVNHMYGYWYTLNVINTGES